MFRISKWPSSFGRTVLVLCFIMLTELTQCYENLSRRPTTILSQRSTLNDRAASYGNDGDLRTTYGYCAHTSLGRSKAWFQVDLGKEYSIKSVTIYYRKEGDGLRDWKQYRFRQFYLDASNSSAVVTTTRQRTRCYTDNSTGSDLPPNIIELPCKQTARYVIVETTYDAPEDNPEKGAFLEICEIQVYGCEIGKYGARCRNCRVCQACDIISGDCSWIPCSVNCVSGLCNSTTGYCTQGCIDGYWGSTCTSTCPSNCHGGRCDNKYGNCSSCIKNYWGPRCDKRCSQFCNGGVCDQIYGYCSDGCTQGRYGNICEHTCNAKCLLNKCLQYTGDCTNRCVDFYYGYKCEYQCSSHCSPRSCNRYNGTCTGCSDGYHGLSCRDVCSVNCAEGTCDQQTGRCDRGCKANWDGDQCDRCDQIHYGTDCSQECNVNCKDSACNSRNGSCSRGCKRGYYGDRCTNACPSCSSGCDRYTGDCEGACLSDKYGSKCELPCSPGCAGGCNKVTGACDGGCVVGRFGAYCWEICNTGCIGGCDQNNGRCKCKTGWRGDKCDECSPDYYGQSCDQRCSSHCVNGTCFSHNGTCIGGCTGKFSDDKCIQEYQQTNTNTPDNTMTIVGIVLSVTIVLTGSIITFLLCRRNKTLEVNKGLNENVNSQTAGHELSGIPNNDNPPSPYEEIGDLDKPNSYEDLHQYSEVV